MRELIISPHKQFSQGFLGVFIFFKGFGHLGFWLTILLFLKGFYFFTGFYFF